MADPVSNAGGGAPSDNASILRRLIERGVDGTALGPIWDPIAVRLCVDTGLETQFRCGLVVKSARPRATVRCCRHCGGFATRLVAKSGPTQVPLGASAMIQTGGVEAVLISQPGLGTWPRIGLEPGN